MTAAIYLLPVCWFSDSFLIAREPLGLITLVPKHERRGNTVQLGELTRAGEKLVHLQYSFITKTEACCCLPPWGGAGDGRFTTGWKRAKEAIIICHELEPAAICQRAEEQETGLWTFPKNAREVTLVCLEMKPSTIHQCKSGPGDRDIPKKMSLDTERHINP